MKTAFSFHIRKLMLASIFSMSIGFVSSATAYEYSALDLGDSFASSLNSTGQVVGFSVNPPFSGFITGANGVGKTGLEILPNSTLSAPFKINSGGQVAGISGTVTDWQSGQGVAHAFITGSNGVGLRDIGAAGRTHSAALSLNDSGQVVGASLNSPAAGDFPVFQAFITGPNGTGIRDLGTPQPVNPGESSSFATDINSSGQAVGTYGFINAEGSLGRAFITGSNGMDARDLGTLGGRESGATAINDMGQVVGQSTTTGGNIHAFITGQNGQGVNDLGTLSALGGNYSAANDINASGQVVGSWGPDSDATRAFVTGPAGAGMADLTPLVRIPGVILAEALAVNDRGQILALGSNSHSYLLTKGDGSTPDQPLLPNFIEQGDWRFNFENEHGQRVFVDPPIAVGYDYMVNSGPHFQSALFPSVAGDTNGYEVFGFNAQTNSYDIPLGHVTPGEVFTFHDGGVSRFELRGIDTTAGLGADNPLAFPTGLTFIDAGTVSMTQSPIGVVPEPEAYALLLAGLGLVGFMARRKKQYRSNPS